jgi:hypothetical protein
MSTEIQKSFESAIISENTELGSQLLDPNNINLTKLGPFNKNEAFQWFGKYRANTFPLYILNINEEYFVFH